MLEKKVRKELKQTLKHTKDLVSVYSSTMIAVHRDAAGDQVNQDKTHLFQARFNHLKNLKDIDLMQ